MIIASKSTDQLSGGSKMRNKQVRKLYKGPGPANRYPGRSVEVMLARTRHALRNVVGISLVGAALAHQVAST
jgi:hypothetical protein